MSEDHVGFLMQDSRRDCGYARQFLSEGVHTKSMAGYWAASLKLSESSGMPLCRSNNSQRLSGQKTGGS